jgi:hypothetical protein
MSPLRGSAFLPPDPGACAPGLTAKPPLRGSFIRGVIILYHREIPVVVATQSLKFARNDKNKRLVRPAEAVPFQNMTRNEFFSSL